LDPFSLIAAGAGTLGSLAGGIYNAATAPKRKRDWKKKQKRNALFDLERNYAAEMGMPTYDIDAMRQNQGIDEQADEQFKVDPMSFVPFVNNASQLASGIYQAANSGGQQEGRLAPDPIARQQQAAQSQQDALERAQAMQFFKQQGWKPYGRY
jgi:hypothetical protein